MHPRHWIAVMLISTFAVACGGTPGARPSDMSAAEHETTAARYERTGDTEETAAHRKMAADHRAASKALRDAEASACAGLSEADRDLSPFEHRENVIGVEELHEKPFSAKQTGPGAVDGAAVTIRAVPGLTKEYLQRLIRCHLARNATMGYAMPEMSFCPLAVKGASASVESTGAGFRVDVRGDSGDSIAEIVRRAKALVQPK